MSHIMKNRMSRQSFLFVIIPGYVYSLVILSNVQTPFLYMQRPELFVLYTWGIQILGA
jgi:hypothetical protein